MITIWSKGGKDGLERRDSSDLVSSRLSRQMASMVPKLQESGPAEREARTAHDRSEGFICTPSFDDAHCLGEPLSVILPQDKAMSFAVASKFQG